MRDEIFPNFQEMCFNKEPNISLLKQMFEDLKEQGYKYIPDVICEIVHDVSAQSSTVNLFQVIDLDILKDLEKNLRSSAQLITDKSTLMLRKSCIKMYPVVYDRLKQASPLSNGNLHLVSSLFLVVVRRRKIMVTKKWCKERVQE